jgi:hypothetical protein
MIIKNERKQKKKSKSAAMMIQHRQPFSHICNVSVQHIGTSPYSVTLVAIDRLASVPCFGMLVFGDTTLKIYLCPIVNTKYIAFSFFMSQLSFSDLESLKHIFSRE